MYRNIKEDERFAEIDVKLSDTDKQPFVRMNVKIKPEIVTIGALDVPVDPSMTVGEYVLPRDWNSIIRDEDVTVIDCRNDYEYDIGTFERAVNPNTKTFKDFPAYVEDNLDPTVHKKIAMFCTGGIRCEKASSYMLAKGFETVYHLKGGVLKYLEEYPAQVAGTSVSENSGDSTNSACSSDEPTTTITPDSSSIPDDSAAPGNTASTDMIPNPSSVTNHVSAWQGQCFVFDDRVSVGHGLSVGDYTSCRGCRYPNSTEDRSLPENQYKEGVYCRYCVDVLTDDQKAANQERHSQMLLAQKNNKIHLGRAL